MDNRSALREVSRQLQSLTKRRFSPMFVKRMLEAQHRERQQITAEFVKVKGLMPLLMKHRNGGHWSPDERIELTQQMQAIAYLSPYLVVMVMPGSFLALPVLAWWLDRRRLNRNRGTAETKPQPQNSQDI